MGDRAHASGSSDGSITLRGLDAHLAAGRLRDFLEAYRELLDLGDVKGGRIGARVESFRTTRVENLHRIFMALVEVVEVAQKFVGAPPDPCGNPRCITKELFDTLVAQKIAAMHRNWITSSEVFRSAYENSPEESSLRLVLGSLCSDVENHLDFLRAHDFEVRMVLLETIVELARRQGFDETRKATETHDAAVQVACWLCPGVDVKEDAKRGFLETLRAVWPKMAEAIAWKVPTGSSLLETLTPASPQVDAASESSASQAELQAAAEVPAAPSASRPASIPFERLRLEARELSEHGDPEAAQRIEATVNWDNERRGAAPTFASEIQKADVFPASTVPVVLSDGSEHVHFLRGAGLEPPRRVQVTAYGMADEGKQRLWLVVADPTGRAWQERKHRRYVVCLQHLAEKGSVELASDGREFVRRFGDWISVKCHLRYTRRGPSITLDEPVTFLEATGDYTPEVTLRRLETDQVMDKAREQFLR